MFRVVLSLYPRVDSTWFDNHSSAIAICWCNNAVKASAVAAACDELFSEGWHADAVIEIVAKHGVAEESERDLRIKARAQGVAFSAALMRRLWIPGSETDRKVYEGDVERPLAEPFAEFCASLSHTGSAVTLYSSADRKHALAQFLDQEAFPLWKCEADTSAWVRDWPSDYTPHQTLIRTELHELLVAADHETQLIALCLEGNLYTFHPMSLLDVIGVGWWERWALDRHVSDVTIS